MKKEVLKYVFLWTLIVFLFGLLILFSLFIYYGRDLPRPEKFTERTIVESTKIYDRSGKTLLYELYGEERREFVLLKDVPDYLIQAIIATEDSNFYSHKGIDLGGIIRSLQENLRKGRTVGGGSTITQQLIRTTFLTLDRTIERKIKEIILAVEIERRYSKEEILEWYLNQIPLGPNIYGMETASQYYFNKSVSEISLPEAAVLTALINAPSRLSRNKQELLVRKDFVINRMLIEKYITKDQAEEFKKKEIIFTENTHLIKAPHFVLGVQNYLLQEYGRSFLEQKGLKVITSLDWKLQQIAENVVLEHEQRIKGYNAHNAGLIALDPRTGEILAMVGSKNWFANPYPENCLPGKTCLFDPEVNVTTFGGGRQPGSALKPLFYAMAFEKGYTDETIVIDEETNFGIFGGKPYIPRNYDGLFRGEVTLRESLAQSLNIPSVKVLAYLVGLENGIKNLERFGLTTFIKPPSFYGLSIVLGGGEVKLLELTSAYGVFATEGLLAKPFSILKIQDNQENVLKQNNPSAQRILQSSVARMITDILSDNEARAPMFGSRSIMYFDNHQIAAKTGTSNDFRDAWIIGYTPSLVVGVWVGNNNNEPMIAPGVTIAGPIWRDFMEKVL
ncbi:MAG: PBP1A family penicillin-binding protein [Candidatus Pacebacteria bacterium]|nr:PBP1A family penicillin-binding protein [Candidatus Paceibacterota bacterium]